MSEAEQLSLGDQRSARPLPSGRHEANPQAKPKSQPKSKPKATSQAQPAPRARASTDRGQVEWAAEQPVARVRIDAQIPHLDRDFDYAVPASMSDTAVVGARVRVRFSGRLTDAVVVARADEAAVAGELRRIERVIGAEPVLTGDTIALIEAVADRYAGTFSDVMRAAVPPRHARAEARAVEECTWRAAEAEAVRWSVYGHGEALLRKVSAPATPRTAARAAWAAAPATPWADDVAALVRAVLAEPVGGALVVVPDAVSVDRMLAACRDAVEADAVAVLTAEAGPERRYGQFLKALRGGARLVIGTRASVFAPVRDLRLVVVWDDGDDALCDPQAPYWDARDVAALRSHLSGCHLVVGSPARSVVTQQWCESGFAKSITATRAALATLAPRVSGVQESDVARDEAAAVARMPHRAWQTAREALARGAVLVQVGRRGYLPGLSCQKCRTSAHCACGGPLQLASGARVPACAWCGALAPAWSCPACGSRQLRASVIGAERTVEEIGRAFPGVPVVASHGGHRLAEVDGSPSVIVSTQGAEPECKGGYAAVVILDARSALQRMGLDAGEEAVRRWMSAARLAAPRAPVVIAAEHSVPAVQAVVRWDPAGWAQRELADRVSAGLPPAVRMAALLGAPEGIIEAAAALEVPHRLLGPVPAGDARHPDRERGLVAVTRDHGAALGRELRAITATRSARGKGADIVHVHLDPRDI